MFHFDPDSAPHWEASYYRSLRDADGVILIGGATSVIVTGYLALGFRIPVLTLATFGGGAQQVWKAILPDRDLAMESERDLMGAPTWTAASAELCVACLEDQRARLQREQAGQNTQADAEKRDKRLRHLLTLVS